MRCPGLVTEQSQIQEAIPSPDKLATTMPLTRRRLDNSVPQVPLSQARSTHRFNGIDGISISQAGSWLDTRPFNEACSAAGANSKLVRGSIPAHFRKKMELSEGERFFLKRCKDTLLNRFGTLEKAFKAMDLNKSTELSQCEFVGATHSLFGKAGSQILARLFDINGDGVVTLNEFQTRLDVV